MERSMPVEGAERADLSSTYDLEKQLESAERRYATARAATDKAREEWRALASQTGADPRAVRVARAKFDAVAARCARLRDLIDQLEEKLDV